MHLLTVNKKPVNVFHIGNRPYWVVFNTRMHVQQVRNAQANHIYLKRSGTQPLSSPYTKQMELFGIPSWTQDNLSMDQDAYAVFERKAVSQSIQLDSEGYSLYHTLYLPVDERIGVILPKQVVDITEHSVVFAADVIDPVPGPPYKDAHIL